MNIVVLTTRLFDTPRSGGEIGTARLLGELLAAGHNMHVIGRGPVPRPDSPTLRYRSLGPLVQPFSAMPLALQLASLLAAWAAGRASTIHRHLGGGSARRARRLLALGRGPAPDVLLVDHLQAWPWLVGAGADLPAPLLLMHNVESDCYAERARNPQLTGWFGWLQRKVFEREARLLRRLELRTLQCAAAVACVSDADAARLGAMAAASGCSAPVLALALFPLHLPTAAALAPRAAASALRRIGMIGTWTWGPNQIGLGWMLERVLPLLPQHCVLVLAGAGLEGRALPPGVVSMGRIDDARTFYDSVDVVAIASLAGSGVQEKTVDAIALARIVVATPHALRGLGGDLPGNVRVAADPLRFAGLCADAGGDAKAADSARIWARQRQDRYRHTLQRCLMAAAGHRAGGCAP